MRDAADASGTARNLERVVVVVRFYVGTSHLGWAIDATPCGDLTHVPGLLSYHQAPFGIVSPFVSAVGTRCDRMPLLTSTLTGFEPTTFWMEGERSNHYARMAPSM